MSVATNEKWTDKQTGELREATEWHRLVFTGRLAEVAAQYLRKGSYVYAEGMLKTRKWQDQNNQDRYTTEIRVLNMQMLGGGQPQSGNQGQPQGGNQGQPQGGYQNQPQGGYQNQPQGGYQNQPSSNTAFINNAPIDDDIPF